MRRLICRTGRLAGFPGAGVRVIVNHPRRSTRAKAALASATAGLSPSPSPVRRPRAAPPLHDLSLHDAEWASFLVAVQARFDAVMATGAPLFRTDARGLYKAYVASLPEHLRPSHRCEACRGFLDRFGGLATISTTTRELRSVLPPSAAVPHQYVPAVEAMRGIVSRTSVTGVFLPPTPVLGVPVAGNFTHLSLRVPEARVARATPLLSVTQMEAEKAEEFRSVSRAVGEFAPANLHTALSLLEAEALPDSARFLAPMRWLADLSAKVCYLSGPARDNPVWLAVAQAPADYCHPRSGMIGSLLDDLAARRPVAECVRRFAARMHPLKYQRPQAAPRAQAIERAERMVARLGIARSLERRYAALHELEALWTPSVPQRPADLRGVFAHVVPRGEPPYPAMPLTGGTITWEKFRRAVLPTAERMEFLVPSSGPFLAFTTAVHADAPCIMRWGSHVAWYLHVKRSGTPTYAREWGLTPGARVRVSAVVPLPTLWSTAPKPHLGNGHVLVLDGARDTTGISGNALFPACLREDLHEVRSVVEAYSATATVAPAPGGVPACGYDLRVQHMYDCSLRVLRGGIWTDWRVDRWD